MGRIISVVILGIFILLAAVVIAEPSCASNAWSLAMGLLSVLGMICIVGIIAIVVIVIVVLIFAYKLLEESDL